MANRRSYKVGVNMSSEAPENPPLGPEDPPPGREKRRPGSRLSSPKTDPKQPVSGPKLELIEVSLAQIRGLDPDIQLFFGGENFNFQNAVDFKIWSPEAARLAYLMAPMILIKRSDGFDILGSGRSWRIAQSIFQADSNVPALVLAETTRVAVADKLQFAAVELLGLYADFRTRPHLPAKLMNMWSKLNAMGVKSILGSEIKAFSRGTGFSMKSLEPPKKSISMQNTVAAMVDATGPDE